MQFCLLTYLLNLIKDAIVSLDRDEPTTSTDIRSYIYQNNEDTKPATDNANNVPSTSRSFDVPQNCQDVSTINLEEECALCDIERQRLREMFPTCNENVFTPASRSATLDLAVDYIMNHSVTDASMYAFEIHIVVIIYAHNKNLTFSTLTYHNTSFHFFYV